MHTCMQRGCGGQLTCRMPVAAAVTVLLMCPPAGWLVLRLSIWPAGCLKFSLPAAGGWEFKQGVDSGGNDIINSGITTGNWQQLIDKCDLTPGCKAANTGGW